MFGSLEVAGISLDDASGLLSQSKAVALVAYLALPVLGRYQRRDRLVALLWPDLDQERARAALRKTVHAVRSTLGKASIVSRGDEELAIERTALSCDASDFFAAIDANQLARALELYRRGELLDGFHVAGSEEFSLWVDGQRRRAREVAVAAALALSREADRNDLHTDAGRWASAAVEFDWANERVVRHALAMLEKIGDRAGALRLYEDFAKRLRISLDVDPSDETRRAAEAIRLRA